jgi:subtilase family serine protease
MSKRVLTVIILLVTVAALGGQLFCPVDYAGKVARAESGPDLIVTVITSSPETPTFEDEVTFTVTISNQGAVASGQCYVAYYIDGDYLDRDYVPPLNPGASTKNTFTWTAEAGIHDITAVADYLEEVNESVEGNNEKTFTLSTLGADLIIDSITWSPSNPAVGETVFFAVKVKNRGAVVAISSRVYFYIGGAPRGYQDGGKIYPGETRTLTFPWYTKTGPHEVKAIVDQGNIVPETDEDNNEMTAVFSVLLPDLIIDEIERSPEAPSIGDNVSFMVSVTNQGSAASGMSVVDFYMNDKLVDTGWVEALEPGASGNATFYWIARTGTYDIKATVTTGGFLTESDETNNEKAFTFSPGLADFIVQDITWTPTELSIGDRITFTVTVANQGAGDAADSRVELYIDSVKLNHKEFGDLDAGDTVGVTFTWRATEGSHQIKAIIDTRDEVPESDETNNEKTVTFSTPTSDLIVEQIIWTPLEPVIGDMVTFTVTVKNQGGAGSDYTHVNYYIDDSQVSSDYIEPISANTTDNQTFTWTAIAGEHVIKAFVDFINTVSESDETNNEKSITLTPIGPDLIVESIDWSHNDPPVGETVTFTVTVQNNGGSRADASLVHIYIDDTPRGYQDIPETDPGTKIIRTFDWKVTAGTHSIRAVIDEANLIAETNETNNETLIGYPMPDLTFEAVTWSPVNPALGDKVTLTAYVKNKGSHQAGGFQLCFYVDDSAADYREIPQLDAGARVTNTFAWEATTGTHTFTLVADAANSISEGVENNNEETVTFAITAPDLTIASIIWPAEETAASDNVTFTVTIRNQGDARARYSSVSYYVDGKYLASGQIEPLEPDAETNKIFSTWMSQGGPHTLMVVIDEGNQLPESSEVNNERAVNFTSANVTPSPEPVPVPTTKPRPRPTPIQLTPTEEEEGDSKTALLFFGVAVLIFGATLVFSLLREMRKRR